MLEQLLPGQKTGQKIRRVLVIFFHPRANLAAAGGGKKQAAPEQRVSVLKYLME